jgi:glycosyltransferase involved in cell wall biosynthesis
LARLLNQLGCTADIYGPYSRNIAEYDLILHFSVHGGGIQLFNEVIKYGKPVVLWPNYWPDPYVDLLSIKDMVEHYANNSEILIFKSVVEKNIFLKNFNIKNVNKLVIRPVFDGHLNEGAPEKLFEKLYGIKDYALCIGIIEPNKNTLKAIEATKKLGITLVVVGRYRDRDYYEECKKNGSNVIFIDSLPAKSEILRSAIKDARFFIELSEQPPGVSALEAAFLGSNLVLGDSQWSREHFHEDAFYCDPDDENSILSAINAALKSNKDLKIKLAKRMKNYSNLDELKNLVKILYAYKK